MMCWYLLILISLVISGTNTNWYFGPCYLISISHSWTIFITDYMTQKEKRKEMERHAEIYFLSIDPEQYPNNGNKLATKCMHNFMHFKMSVWLWLNTQSTESSHSIVPFWSILPQSILSWDVHTNICPTTKSAWSTSSGQSNTFNFKFLIVFLT